MPQTINDMIATWDNSLTTFSAIKMNVTDTASAAGSLLMDLQVGGTSKVAFGKNGSLSLNGGPLNTGELNTPTSGGLRFGSAIHGVFPNGSNEIHLICAGTTAAFFRNSATFAVFNNSMGLSNASATADVIIGRRAAANPGLVLLMLVQSSLNSSRFKEAPEQTLLVLTSPSLALKARALVLAAASCSKSPRLARRARCRMRWRRR